MRKEMRDEHGQATVEWAALLLLIALALLALSQLAPTADGQELGTTLAHSVTGVEKTTGVEEKTRPQREILSTRPSKQTPFTAAVRPSLPQLPWSLRKVGRGAGRLWRKAWFACLVYERTRYAFRHPESRIPGYTLPYDTALRMISNCVSPVDLLRDLPGGAPAP